MALPAFIRKQKHSHPFRWKLNLHSTIFEISFACNKLQYNMKQLKSTLNDLHRLFETGILVQSIASQLECVQVDDPFETAKSIMAEKDFDVLGVRQNGLVVGFLERNSVIGNLCSDVLVPFKPGDLIAESSSLRLPFRKLKSQPRLFILTGDNVDGIVTRGDLQKAPVRMWLFSLVTLSEMQMQRLILSFHPSDWQEFLKGARLQKAQETFKLRQEKNENTELIDCLQFIDKVTIIIKSPNLRESLNIQNNKKESRMLKEVETLRNDLAHAQDIITGNWPKVAEIAEDLEGFIERCENVVLSDQDFEA